MKATLNVPLGGGYFEGHFPGRPILPGIVELLLVLEALSQESKQAVTLRGIAFARLRQLVLPGERLELVARELDRGHLRIDLTRDGIAVANGELITGHPEEPRNAATRHIAAAGASVSAPALDALLPHRPPMRFVNSITGESVDGLDCLATIPAACALVCGTSGPVLAAVEAAAQTAATWEALQRWRQSSIAAPRVGYLVALRDVVFFSERVPADRPFVASVRLDAAAPPLAHYRFETTLDGFPLVRGMIATFLAA